MRYSRLHGLVMNQFTYLNGHDEVVVVETNGAYGEAVRGLDKGDPLSLLDVIDAEASLKLIDEDEAAKAAATLAMCGWKPEQLGGLFHPRLGRGRPGRRLLRDAIEMIVSRQKRARYDEIAKRKELRDAGIEDR